MNQRMFNEITIMQYIFLIHGAEVGIGVLSLPRDVAEISGTDGWMSILLGWILATLSSLLIVQIMKKHPENTIIDLLKIYFGKWIGTLLIVGLIMYLVLSDISSLFNSVTIIRVWFLPQTSNYIIMLLFMLPCYFIARHGLRVMARYSELVALLLTWMPFFLWYPLHESHWVNLLPFFKEGIMPVLKGVKTTILSFSGFELAFFLYPFLQKKESASVGIFVANTLSMVVFLSVAISSFVFFTPDGITQYVWPTLSLLKVIELRFVERLEIVFLSLYLFILSTTWLPYMFFAVFSSSQLAGKQDHHKHLIVYLCLLVVSSFFYQPTFVQADTLKKIWSNSTILVGCVFPVFLWGYIKLFHLVRGRNGG